MSANDTNTTNFYIHDLLTEDGSLLSNVDFGKAPSKKYSKGVKNVYIFFTKIDNHGVWIKCRFGQMNRPNWWEYTTHEETTNLRTEDQIEPTNEFFSYFDFSQKSLFINTSQNSSLTVIREFMEEITGKKLFVKNRYDYDTFMKNIKTIKNIKFVARYNLLNQNSELLKQVKNIFGTDQLLTYSVEAELQENDQRHFLQKMQEALNERYTEIKSGSLGDLICVGKDDKGVQQTFNTDHISKKFTVRAPIDKDRFFNENDLYDALLSQIKNF